MLHSLTLLSSNPPQLAAVPSAAPKPFGRLFKILPVGTSSSSSIRPNALAVNYNSPISVFPAEACETIGGETCLLADIYPEVKLVVKGVKEPKISEPFERDHVDYTTNPRTVLLGDACDVLGGGFCEQLPHKM